MNIIATADQPQSCPGCGNARGCQYRACIKQCQRSDAGNFFDAGTMNTNPRSLFHVHVKCSDCGFEYLSEGAHPDEVERVW